MPALRIIFMGTAELACPSLRALHQSPTLNLVAVVTQPDRPKGRLLKLHPSPVKALALAAGLPVLQPERARHDSFLEQLRPLAPELIVVAAYGQILPPQLLALPRYGCINVHASLLPKYRGAAPIQWAILNDESTTGVTIMQLDEGLDTGPILAQQHTPITAEDTAQSLHDRLATLGADLLARTIPNYVAGTTRPQPQPAEGAVYARKITRQDGHLHWSQPARVLWNRVRAFVPWPGTFTFHPAEPKPCLLKIWSAQVEPEAAGEPGRVLRADKRGILVACGQQALRLLELQRESGRRLPAQEFLAGHPILPGELLS